MGHIKDLLIKSRERRALQVNGVGIILHRIKLRQVRAVVPYSVLSVACDHLLGIKTDKRVRRARFVQTIIHTLELYRHRGEFDGTIPGAIRCLAQSGYFEGLFHD